MGGLVPPFNNPSEARCHRGVCGQNGIGNALSCCLFALTEHLPSRSETRELGVGVRKGRLESVETDRFRSLYTLPIRREAHSSGRFLLLRCTGGLEKVIHRSLRFVEFGSHCVHAF